jgi:hypothetical protein
VRNVYRLILSALLVLASGLAGAQVKVNALPSATTIPIATDFGICDQSIGPPIGTNKCTYSQIAASVSNLLGLGTFATANAATPPAIGGTTPNAGSFTTLNLSAGLTVDILGLTQCLHVNSVGVVSGTGADCGAGGGGSFSALTSGVNTSATMIVGTGGSLGTSGSGSITATAFSGLLPIASGGTGASTLLAASLPVFSGAISSGDCAQWSATGTLVDSGGACGSGGSNAFSALTSSTNSTAAMVVGSGASLGHSGTGTIAATSVTGLTFASGKTLTVNNILTLAGTDSTTFTFPGTSGTVSALNNAQTFTAAQTFTNSDLLLLGSSTGATTFTSANASATNYTMTFPAVSDTVVTLGATQTLSNKSVAATEINSGCCIAVAQGGTGTASPNLVAGTNVTISGIWPNQTINSSGGGSGAFSGISSGTNTSAAMLVGSGATFGPTGSGTITATSLPVGGLSGLGANTIAGNAGSGSAALTPAQSIGVLNSITCNAQTGTAYTTVIGDANSCVTMNNAAANAVTIPPNSSVAYPVGTVLTFEQLGAGLTTITEGAGVTFCQWQGGCSTGVAALATVAPYDIAQIKQTATNTWLVTQSTGLLSANAPQVVTATKVNARVQTVATGTSITPIFGAPTISGTGSDTIEQANTGGAGTLTINNATGTAADGDRATFRLACTNTQTLAWGSVYHAGSNALPTSCPAGTHIYVGFIYDSTTAQWDYVATAGGF